MSLRIGSDSGSGAASGFDSRAVRKKLYKSIIDAEKGRRRREEELVVMRKSKRQEYLLKKRKEIQAKSFEMVCTYISFQPQLPFNFLLLSSTAFQSCFISCSTIFLRMHSV